MTINYKDTIQYKEEYKLFKIFLLQFIICFSIFLMLFIGIFFFLKKISLDVAFEVSIIGIFMYLIIFFPFLVKAIRVKNQIKLVSTHINEAYIFRAKIEDHSNHLFCQSKFTVTFTYKNNKMKMTTSWIYDSNNLENSYVEFSYI